MENKEENIAVEPNMKLGKTILFTFLKSVGLLLAMVFWFISVCVCLAPKTAIKIFDTFNASKASTVCYERIYKYDNKNTSLYNLINSALASKSYKTASKYIPVLQKKTDYVEFVKKVDSVSIAQSIENNGYKYVAYVGDLDGFLCGQYVTALYNTNKKDAAKEETLKGLVSVDNLYSFPLSNYVDALIQDKKIADLEKTLADLLVATASTQQTVQDLVDVRLELLDESHAVDDKIDHILRVYTSMKIYNTMLKIRTITGDESGADLCETKIATLRERYNTLIS